MPTNLFYTVTVPCSIWIINRNKKQHSFTLFINANNMGTMVTRKLRELSQGEILTIAKTYHNYQNDNDYEDKLGYCKKVSMEEIESNDCVLTPGRYVGTEELEDDGISFEEKIFNIKSSIEENIKESHRLDSEILDILSKIGVN